MGRPVTDTTALCTYPPETATIGGSPSTRAGRGCIAHAVTSRGRSRGCAEHAVASRVASWGSREAVWDAPICPWEFHPADRGQQFNAPSSPEPSHPEPPPPLLTNSTQSFRGYNLVLSLRPSDTGLYPQSHPTRGCIWSSYTGLYPVILHGVISPEPTPLSALLILFQSAALRNGNRTLVQRYLAHKKQRPRRTLQ